MVLLIVLLFIFAVVFTPSTDQETPGSHFYPWNIEVDSHGYTQVFGVTIGQSTWLDVNKHFNKYGKLAVFDDGKGQLSLEGFLGDITVSGITGRMILALEADQELLQKLMQGARKQEAQKSGAIRYTIDHGQRRDIVDLPVISLTFIPVVDLEPELIKQRFGEPDRIISMPFGVRHFIYLHKGLDIIVDNSGKEVLQYVIPAKIDNLIPPLFDKGGKDE
jgi:hypothetical protein